MLPEKCGDMLIIEGKSSTEESIEDDTTRPNINFRPSVQLAGYNLRGSIVGRSAGSAQEFSVL